MTWATTAKRGEIGHGIEFAVLFLRNVVKPKHLILEKAAEFRRFFLSTSFNAFIASENSIWALTSTICRIFFSNVHPRAMYKDVTGRYLLRHVFSII
jgi:hypothetical protein